jgi:hypothetical protein
MFLAAEHFPEARVKVIDNCPEIRHRRWGCRWCLHFISRTVSVRPFKPFCDTAVVLLGFDSIVRGVKNAIVPGELARAGFQEEGDGAGQEPGRKDWVKTATDKSEREGQHWFDNQPA